MREGEEMREEGGRERDERGGENEGGGEGR